MQTPPRNSAFSSTAKYVNWPPQSPVSVALSSQTERFLDAAFSDMKDKNDPLSPETEALLDDIFNVEKMMINILSLGLYPLKQRRY